MKVEDFMTANPACCTTDTGLQEVARMMVDHDCGEIPVVLDASGRCCGVVAQADIARHDGNKCEVAKVLEKISQPLQAAT